MIDDALAKGAKVVAGGKADGAVMPATILDQIDGFTELKWTTIEPLSQSYPF